MTLDGVMGLIFSHFTDSVAFEVHYVNVVKDIGLTETFCDRNKCRPRYLVFTDVSFIAIFSARTLTDFTVDGENLTNNQP